MPVVNKVAVPQASRIRAEYIAPDLADAYEIALPDHAVDDPEALARHLFADNAK